MAVPIGSLAKDTAVSRSATWRIIWRGAIAIFILSVVAILAYNDVSTALTQDDKVYADRFLRDAGHSDPLGRPPATAMDDQVRVILTVQDAVLSLAAHDIPIALDREREPKDVYEAKSGLCYDRSRTIEKILSSLGYEVRHASVYSTDQTNSSILSLFTPQVSSHAVSEVKTAQGWLVVDSNSRWIGLTREGEPIDLAELRANPELNKQPWDLRVTGQIDDIFQTGFVYVIGLYSRHGRFYPPYTPVPDIDWGQVAYNVTG